MALADRVQDRIQTQKLIELTQINNRGATVVSGTVLTNAANDTIGDLKIYAGVDYDETDDRIVAAAIIGVVLRLKSYKLESQADDRLAKWQEGLKKHLRMVTANNRIRPKSSSELTPAEENPSGGIKRPAFDVNVTGADFIPGFDERDDRGRLGLNR